MISVYMSSSVSRFLCTKPSKHKQAGWPTRNLASTSMMLDHLQHLYPRSIGHGFRTLLFFQDMHRGHPMCCLLYGCQVFPRRTSSTKCSTHIHVPVMEHASSVASEHTTQGIVLCVVMFHSFHDGCFRCKPPTKKLNERLVALTRRCIHHVSAEEAQDDADVVLKTLLVNSHPASVLFDSGASHSFISGRYASLHNIAFVDMPTPLVIQAPGSKWKTNAVSHGNQILIDGLVFLASLIPLKTSDINIILGMD